MERTLLLATRYLTIFSLVLGIAVPHTGQPDFRYIILALLFMINTQVRYFSLPGRPALVGVSILFDFAVAHLIINTYHYLLLPFFILLLLDSAFLIESKLKYTALAIGLLDFTYLVLQQTRSMWFPYLAAMPIIALLILSALKSENRRAALESLNYELRQTRDELLKTNKELELFANSVKELTLLQERNRISREIHDSVGHCLSTIIIQLEAIEKTARKDDGSAAQMARDLRSFAKSGLEEIRKALRELKPKDFKDDKTLMLISSLTTNFSKLTGIEVNLGFSKSGRRMSETAALVLYRAVQEFLSNSARHGKATKINIFIHFDDESVILTMKDNGVGTDSVQPGMGIGGLIERVKELGGRIQYESSAGKGFSLRVALQSEFLGR